MSSMDIDVPENLIMPNSTDPSTVDNSMPQTPETNEQGYDADEAFVPAEQQVEEEEEEEVDDPRSRVAALEALISKSGLYARLIGERMERQRAEKAAHQHRQAVRAENKAAKAAALDPTPSAPRTTSRLAGKKGEVVKEEPVASGSKRKRQTKGKVVPGRGKGLGALGEMDVDDVKPILEAVKHEDAAAEAEQAPVQYIGEQPALITGATLRDYQLAGVQWMISLYENGSNGILADEMGLGKTLQTIAFLAYLCEKGTTGPFLIVCPLSVLANWVTEFKKFAPDIPTVMYHGSIEHRQQLREQQMGLQTADALPKTAKAAKKAATEAKLQFTFPVIITTYEIVIRDQKYLSKYQWKYIVVDEGHRLKNFDCLLLRQLKTYTSANRLILTGTPLHNNLMELWSLLNFILPELFDDKTAFQNWFQFDGLSQGSAGELSVLNQPKIVEQLHEILKPFLLRRLKTDVEPDLPMKKEYILYAPMTQQQKDVYQAIIDGGVRQYLINQKSGFEDVIDVDALSDPESEDKSRISGRLKKKPRISYAIEENDNKYIDDLESGRSKPVVTYERPSEDIARDWAVKSATKTVSNMKLQNMIMQLRKISSHPFLFDWPIDPMTGTQVVNEDLVNASGKMLLLQRLLDALFARNHRVLLFSQFTSMLDVIEDWAVEFKQLQICRIDGSTKQEDRLRQMNEFNEGRDDPNACRLFLLSTRAGGLGINLVSADTVIFYDQDWNPQQDLQAAARAHRIGQTKPVLVFRLVSEHTIEQKMLEKASNKRKLEALVISQGKFGKIVNEKGEVTLGQEPKKSKAESSTELAKALLGLDGEAVRIVNKDDRIIADEDLDILLDRSPEAMNRATGWAGGAGTQEDKKAFAVFETVADDTTDTLDKLFGQGDE